MNTAECILPTIRSSDLKAPSRLQFGSGTSAGLTDAAGQLAPEGRVLLMIGPSTRRHGLDRAFLESLEQHGHEVSTYLLPSGEPTAHRVNDAADDARRCSPALVIALGGGSVIDTGKAIAALAVNDGPVEEYLEGVGSGKTLDQTPLPCIAVPTTAGTGAEMTKNSVVADYERRYKKSMRDERMIPAASLVDPDLTLTVPWTTTAAGGMDAITQLIEPCLSAKRRPETTALALQALPGCREALRRLHESPGDLPARTTLALASMTSGVCLANAGLALAHGIASGMGAVCPVPHGLICGVLLPHTLRWNREACAPELGAALAAFLGEPELRPDTVDRGITALDTLNHDLGLPPDFKHLDLDRSTVAFIAENSQGSSMTGNPVPMNPDDTLRFLADLI